MPKTIVQRIKAFNNSRIPKMVQLKYRYMNENMFRFYRGTCHIFYEDLATASPFPYSPHTWISGDLHIENFGSYKGDNRVVYFDLNDFDEAILAPATWEAARMTTSIFVAFQSLKIGQKKAVNMAKLYIKQYAATLAFGKPNYIEPRTASGIVQHFLSSAAKSKRKKVLRKRTEKNKEGLTIQTSHPKHFNLDEKLKQEVCGHIDEWLQHDSNSPYNYKVVDAVFRIAGTGSMGLKRYVLLLRSLNDNGEKHLLLDMKQAVPSSLQPYTQITQPKWNTEAERIWNIQQIMQNRAPALFSTTIFNGDAYIIQEMQPAKDNINFKLIRQGYRDMYQVIGDMGMLTASSQLRSCSRYGSSIADELVAFGNDQHWQQAVLEYAMAYTEKVRDYYAQFKQAMKDKGLRGNML